ncbi:thialysine N-epsilon-acetyltransferase [Spodoptera frugiperda]|uniref:Thialysine N-epsilon-acetyltransferase n=1 Tax=Spodoptera frugiperda TaxID=7108 RepID=A0A9R0CUT4_SPOFR|nr:thialysine N-epsilon-acetyltransferase [Spodoptera frugiperda]
MSAQSESGGGGGGGDAEPVVVRPATRQDMPRVLDMIQELAEFEGEPRGPQLSVADLIEDGFEANPPWFFGLIAECGGEVVGHALCNRAYSSWTRRAFYVEDLYVLPGARRRGVGICLLRELCRMAVQEGVHRVDWHVLQSNSQALAFYSRLGARDLRVTEGRAALRLDRPQIESLAQEQR